MSRPKWAIVLAVVVVLGAIGAAYAAGQTKATAPKVVRAQRFELVDAEGRVRGALAFSPDGSPALVFTGAEGKSAAALGVLTGSRPNLMLADKKGKPRAVLTLLTDGTPAFVLWDKEGKVMWSAP